MTVAAIPVVVLVGILVGVGVLVIVLVIALAVAAVLALHESASFPANCYGDSVGRSAGNYARMCFTASSRLSRFLHFLLPRHHNSFYRVLHQTNYIGANLV